MTTDFHRRDFINICSASTLSAAAAEPPPAKRAYDCIVLGLGAMGSACTYQLAKRGASVLGLEQFDTLTLQTADRGGFLVYLQPAKDDR